jgi:tetratricopeptide (TPR) repeat protein
MAWRARRPAFKRAATRMFAPSRPIIEKSSRQIALRLAALVVALLVVAVYLPALHNGFVNWDDNIYVYDNPQIRSLAPSSLMRAFTHLHLASGNWHPLTMVSHAADYAVWGLRPVGHHLTSILLHGFNAALLVLLVARLLQTGAAGRALSRWGVLVAGVVAGLLFGVHPLRVESVAWVSERKDLLSALFYLLGVHSYLHYAEADAVRTWRDRRYLTTLLCFVLALLSKPMALSFPFVLLIIDWYPLGRLARPGLRRLVVEKLPFFVLALALAAVAVLAQWASGAFRPLAEVTLGARVLVAAKATVIYLVKTVLPTGLLPFYSYPARVSLWSWEFGLPLIAVTAALAGCLATAKKHPAFAAVLACYGIVLLPVLGIVQIGPQAMADRYTYLPSVSLVALLGAGFGALWDAGASAWWKRATLVAAGLLVLGLLSCQSVRQIRVWQNGETLWSRVLRHEPWNTEARNNRASYRYDQGEYEKALEDYDAALGLPPLLGQTHAAKRRSAYFNDRAITYLRLGKYAEALADEDQAIGLRPNEASYLFNRGNIYLLVGRYAEARDDLDRAIAAAPAPNPVYLEKRGLVYQRLGMEGKALDDLMRAQTLRAAPRKP